MNYRLKVRWTCPNCMGRNSGICPICKGKSNKEFSMEIKCNACNGTGKLILHTKHPDIYYFCPTCNARGFVDWMKTIVKDGDDIRRHFVHMSYSQAKKKLQMRLTAEESAKKAKQTEWERVLKNYVEGKYDPDSETD